MRCSGRSLRFTGGGTRPDFSATLRHTGRAPARGRAVSSQRNRSQGPAFPPADGQWPRPKFAAPAHVQWMMLWPAARNRVISGGFAEQSAVLAGLVGTTPCCGLPQHILLPARPERHVAPRAWRETAPLAALRHYPRRISRLWRRPCSPIRSLNSTGTIMCIPSAPIVPTRRRGRSCWKARKACSCATRRDARCSMLLPAFGA